MRCANLAILTSSSLVMAVMGCGKVPTWGELTGQQQTPAATQQVPVSTAPVVVAPVAPPADPPAEEVIAKFNALSSAEKNDAAVHRLTSIKEGADRVVEINADGSQLTKAALNNIERLTGLKQLRLNATRMDDEACRKLGTLSGLEVLTLADTQITDVGVAALSSLQNLKHLELTRCRLTENGFRAIGTLPSLKTILIDSTNLNDAWLDLVCNARTLTELTLSRNPITDYGLVALKKVEPLEYLEIGTTTLSCEGLLNVTKGGGLKNLKYLGVYGCPITEKGAKAISTVKSLERLNIGDVSLMNDVGLDFIIKGMKDLKYINLSKCVSIDGSGLRSLKNSKEMEVILIDQCPRVGDPVVQILRTIKGLKRVGLGSTAVTAQGRQALQSALPDLLVQ